MREMERVGAEEYLAARTGRLEYRFLRYAAVADELEAMGMDDSSLLQDVGAGMCDFDFYLRAVRGWKGRYLPVDRSIDGTNLETWRPPVRMPYTVCIETLEHVREWRRLLKVILSQTTVGVVATTPNAGEYGDGWVRDMDPTHVSPLKTDNLYAMGARVTAHSFFGQPRDSLLAVWSAA